MGARKEFGMDATSAAATAVANATAVVSDVNPYCKGCSGLEYGLFALMFIGPAVFFFWLSGHTFSDLMRVSGVSGAINDFKPTEQKPKETPAKQVKGKPGQEEEDDDGLGLFGDV